MKRLTLFSMTLIATLLTSLPSNVLDVQEAGSSLFAVAHDGAISVRGVAAIPATQTAGAVLGYTTATGAATMVTGTANQFLISNGTSTPTFSNMTEEKCAYVERPQTGETIGPVWRTPVAITITQTYCKVDAGTITTTTAAGTGSITCTAAGATSGALSTAVAADVAIDVVFGTVTTATKATVCWRFTRGK